MASRLTELKVQMHQAALAYHTAALKALEALTTLDPHHSGPTLEAISRDRMETYTRAVEGVADYLHSLASVVGKPAERRPPEEREEDWSLMMQERLDAHEGAPRP